jgi:archaeosine-15-forming tRNA-guanine transglycosylase
VKPLPFWKSKSKNIMSRETLADGEYWVTCRERNEISAALNGHSAVFPQARMTVADGWAVFYRNGKEVWTCNARYAAAKFVIQTA